MSHLSKQSESRSRALSAKEQSIEKAKADFFKNKFTPKTGAYFNKTTTPFKTETLSRLNTFGSTDTDHLHRSEVVDLYQSIGFDGGVSGLMESSTPNQTQQSRPLIYATTESQKDQSHSVSIRGADCTQFERAAPLRRTSDSLEKTVTLSRSQMKKSASVIGRVGFGLHSLTKKAISSSKNAEVNEENFKERAERVSTSPTRSPKKRLVTCHSTKLFNDPNYKEIMKDTIAGKISLKTFEPKKEKPGHRLFAASEKNQKKM